MPQPFHQAAPLALEHKTMAVSQTRRIIPQTSEIYSPLDGELLPAIKTPVHDDAILLYQNHAQMVEKQAWDGAKAIDVYV